MNTDSQASTNMESRSSQLISHPASVLYRLWALLALFAFSSLELSPPLAAKYWLLLLTLGVIFSIALTAVWLHRASEQLQNLAKPWVLHWSALLIVCSLTLLNIGLTGFSTFAVAQSLLLLCSLGLMTAGLYLEKRLLSAGIALTFCYLYQLVGGPWNGAFTGIVFAASLWRLSLTSK